MKVGFDISQAVHLGGVATYSVNLAENLSRLGDLDMLFFFSSLRKQFRGNLKNVRRYPFPPTLIEIVFNRFRVLPIERFVGEVDIYHSSDWTQPPTKAKKITTYHDLIPIKFPNWSHPRIVEVQKRRLKLVQAEIDQVIAVSESTKKDLLEISDIPQEKITVIYEGVGENFKPQNEKDISEFKKKYHLPDNFVLAISGVGNRRNLERVKKACQNYGLVILGETLRFVNPDQLPLLYASAKVLLYPSFYEGFGLPVLEAMATGTPVVTSNTSSLPEVGGNAPLYVDPYNQGEIADKVREVLNDPVLRKDMIKRGLLQAKKFSWGKCAEETIKVYKKLYG